MSQEDYNRGRAFGKKLRTTLLPICWVIIIAAQLYDYIVNGAFNIISISTIFILTGPTLRSTKYKDNAKVRVFSGLMLLIGAVLLILGILW